MAEALGVQLGGDAIYGGEVEHRARAGNCGARSEVPKSVTHVAG
jgi:hypothetical protein